MHTCVACHSRTNSCFRRLSSHLRRRASRYVHVCGKHICVTWCGVHICVVWCGVHSCVVCTAVWCAQRCGVYSCVAWCGVHSCVVWCGVVHSCVACHSRTNAD